MLKLIRLEVAGFGPFAEPQTLEFPDQPGVTVIYGENMRGKTSLLNAIRYAFFGVVVSRSRRAQKLHTISNRDLAAEGKYGFSVSLTFSHDDDEYELVRECSPVNTAPLSDADYEESVLLRREDKVLGPRERDLALQKIFPAEISRFFLFDGELLQEYEELLINESDSGHRISEAIERILGVPILKRARAHMIQLSDEADRAAARLASKHKETEQYGGALQLATEHKKQHKQELEKKSEELEELTAERNEVYDYLQSVQRYSAILADRDNAVDRLKQAEKDEEIARNGLQAAMSDAWRSLLRDRVRAARDAASDEAQHEVDHLVLSLRAKAVEELHCQTCDQDISEQVRTQLASTLPADWPSKNGTWAPAESAALARLNDLNRFVDRDNAGEVRELWSHLRELAFTQVTLRTQITDLDAALADNNADALRRSKASLSELSEKIAIVKRAIDETRSKIEKLDSSIQRLTGLLEASGASDLRATQRKARILHASAEVFAGAVESYKAALRLRVESTASALFRSMTTEKVDYAGLSINENYGLTIRHRDGRAEEARSAGAEHVVALALMGALQNNAPLRGPIVMDSPFGRLDDSHTANVISTLPAMAEQVILMVYEAEVGKDRVRELLGARLLREYRLDRLSGRRTLVREVM